MRVAVTGTRGRLGRALIEALEEAPFTGPFGPIAWSRPDFDLDRVESSIEALVTRDRPDVVIHAAAWTDVDGCAREPDLAMARNGDAARSVALACAARGIDLVLVSTNEVFSGDRLDREGYEPTDIPAPPNPYGASKLAGERAATEAYAGTDAALGIVRTAWLFGPGEPDFPRRILAAARRAGATGKALRLVADEWGTPTYTRDVADGIVELLAEDVVTGIHHIVDLGVASRATWAREVLRLARLDVATEDVSSRDWPRPSTPPRWGVLAPTALPMSGSLRPWTDALADYGPAMLRAAAREVPAAGGSA
jgi:dTDP-4-dehydrorhamnose reductase